MKYRQEPADFVVKEIADHKTVDKGKYKLYTLEKEGVETLGLLEELSQIHGIPRHLIGIAGIKDTYARTRQYITVPKEYGLKSLHRVNIEFVGYLNDPIKLGDLTQNKFIITVREIEEYELESVLEKSKTVDSGVLNYFDSQRFGSVVKGEFIGRYLVKKDYEAAVKIFLTSLSGSDDENRQIDKEGIVKAWPKGDSQERINSEIISKDLKNVVDAYNKTRKWIVAYKFIPANLRQMFISAYQSYIWNECIKKMLLENEKSDNLYGVTYAAGELIFNKKKLVDFPDTFQTVSHKVKLGPYEEKVINEVLDKDGISVAKFNIRQTGNFFKSHVRKTMIYPTEFNIQEPKKSEDGKYSITVSFSLPKGCYATVVLKKIFGQ